MHPIMYIKEIMPINNPIIDLVLSILLFMFIANEKTNNK